MISVIANTVNLGQLCYKSCTGWWSIKFVNHHQILVSVSNLKISSIDFLGKCQMAFICIELY